MTGKCCRNCDKLGRLNISKTGQACYELPVVGHSFVMIDLKVLNTFYCSEWKEKGNDTKS